jgi:hypothetical protein
MVNYLRELKFHLRKIKMLQKRSKVPRMKKREHRKIQMLIQLYRMYLLKEKEQGPLLLYLLKGIHKIWREKRIFSQEGQGLGQGLDRKKAGLKMESGKISSIKGTTIIITMIIKTEGIRNTKELTIITISIKRETMIIGRIKTCLIDRDKEKSNISIKIGI